MMRYLSVVGAVVALVAAAVAHGTWTERWGTSDSVNEALERLERLPENVGDWESDPISIDAKELEVARIDGYLSRQYTHRFTGTKVNLLIVCGRPGPISVHTPDVCYRGAGYVPGPIRDRKTEWGAFSVADFKKSGPESHTLRIHWAWSSDGSQWKTESPRWTGALSSAVMYKMYVIVPMTGEATDAENTVTADFFEAVMPGISETLLTE